MNNKHYKTEQLKVKYSFLSFIKFLEKQKRDAEEYSKNNSLILDLIEDDVEDETYEELNDEDITDFYFDYMSVIFENEVLEFALQDY